MYVFPANCPVDLTVESAAQPAARPAAQQAAHQLHLLAKSQLPCIHGDNMSCQCINLSCVQDILACWLSALRPSHTRLTNRLVVKKNDESGTLGRGVFLFGEMTSSSFLNVFSEYAMKTDHLCLRFFYPLSLLDKNHL